MLKTAADISNEQELVLLNLPPSRAQERLALAVLLGLFIVFALITTGALSDVQPGRIDAFVPIYLTVMFVNDSITAILLYAQFPIMRSRAILVIASGYLFTALMVIPYILTFPDVFVPDRGLLGGLQSTSWLYFLQYGAFPVFVIFYAVLKDASPGERSPQSQESMAISRSVALTVAFASALAVLAVAGEPLLPRVHFDSINRTPLWPYVGGAVALVSAVALVVLWFRRRSMLDLSLLLVICVYAMLMPLSYTSGPVRFSVGWYAVRIFAVISSSLVLIFLLYEITTLYARLLQLVRAQRREREARLLTGDAVAATIAHEVKQPLTAMVTCADAGARFLNRSMLDLDKAKEAFTMIASDGRRAGQVIESIRATFRNDARNRTSLDMNELIREAIALERHNLQKHRISVQAQSTTQLPEVRGDRIQLQQVLLNLITNAVDAMAAKEEPRVLSVKSELHADGYVLISVSDTGAGIEPQLIDRIFNPLFTTKSDGMGMGLSICRSIIESHGGRLWAASNTPRGSVFQFTLQASNSTSAGDPASAIATTRFAH